VSHTSQSTSSCWRRIRSYPKYAVSDAGKVMRISTGRVLRVHLNNGYPQVRLYHRRKNKSLRVHRLVAECHVPNPNQLPQVNHKNGIKTDGSAVNLEWVTGAQNVQHAYTHGLRLSLKGSEHGRSKLTESDILQIRFLVSKGSSVSTVAKLFNISRGQTSRIVSRKRWAHLGPECS
jgi:hypothetical protein